MSQTNFAHGSHPGHPLPTNACASEHATLGKSLPAGACCHTAISENVQDIAQTVMLRLYLRPLSTTLNMQQTLPSAKRLLNDTSICCAKHCGDDMQQADTALRTTPRAHSKARRLSLGILDNNITVHGDPNAMCSNSSTKMFPKGTLP